MRQDMDAPMAIANARLAYFQDASFDAGLIAAFSWSPLSTDSCVWKTRSLGGENQVRN